MLNSTDYGYHLHHLLFFFFLVCVLCALTTFLDLQEAFVGADASARRNARGETRTDTVTNGDERKDTVTEAALMQPT